MYFIMAIKYYRSQNNVICEWKTTKVLTNVPQQPRAQISEIQN